MCIRDRISVIDFTDAQNPVEIAFFDRGPIDEDILVLGGYWSSYWYDGRIYASEIVRGLDVFALEPSEYLSPNEIAAAALADQGKAFNPQQQMPVTWPDHPVVGLAYIDQLVRAEALSPDLAAALTGALEQSAAQWESGSDDPELAAQLRSLADDLPAPEAGSLTAQRTAALRSVIDSVAQAVR